ncbi:phosphopantetheine-binding protein [Thioalkalivibrio sp. XN8]|uniref:phosphopantetheine-binding protein n=1 Tax=Thioalkalivibrio sp. XN8 TaxID=2712863 RepID=UPI0013EAEA97|nr:phosphopantetheine-binding protein [Thioalkalivibrio sp. XN8]NGP53687.1 D-alanine--poly(phosphoribitol) ligase subunit 2 [Thioalkalivibrio sp. XN8]
MNTPTPVTIEDLTRLFRERLNLIVDSPDEDLFESGLVDSLSLVGLIYELEQQYGIKIDVLELDFEELQSLRRIANFVERQVEAQ